MFNKEIEALNELNPLSDNFVKTMVVDGEIPKGGTAMFAVIKLAADKLLQANQGNKYKNTVLRVFVISNDKDIYASSDEIAKISNFLLSNKIRIDAFIVSNEIAAELVKLSWLSGGVAMFPKGLNDGLELFNKEEFFNIDIHKFGEIHLPNLKGTDFSNLSQILPQNLDSEIKIKANEYADPKKFVTSPIYAFSEYNKEVAAQMAGSTSSSSFSSPNQKRLINELRQIITNPDDDIRVYPLKDRVDIWRVLIKGFEGSKYESKWFYLIVEFPPEYPQHYPLFRFICPPFHHNITDRGRICIDTLDQKYRSDRSVRELIGEIRYLLFEPNFDSCVDIKREEMKSDNALFDKTIQEWNRINGKNSPEEWEKDWMIQPDGKELVLDESEKFVTVPEQFIDPITRKIMKEPVKAKSGIYN